MDLTFRGLSMKIHVDTLVSHIIQIKTPQSHKSCERKSPKILIFPVMIIQSSFLEISIFFKKLFSPFFLRLCLAHLLSRPRGKPSPVGGLT